MFTIPTFTNPYSEQDDREQFAEELADGLERFAEQPAVRTFTPEFCQFQPGIVTGYREKSDVEEG